MEEAIEDAQTEPANSHKNGRKAHISLKRFDKQAAREVRIKTIFTPKINPLAP
jgi:hypothetical protein